MPPAVTRQRPIASPINHKPAKPPPIEIEPGTKLNVYGRSKTGKTRLASTFPKPLLIVGTEDGTKSIKSSKTKKKTLKSGLVIYSLLLAGKPTGVDFVQFYHTEQLDEIVEELRVNYKSGVLDNGGGLQDIIVKEVLGLEDIPVQRSWGMAQQQDWGVIGAQTKERFRKLLDLADRFGIHIVIIAHERNFNDDGKSSDVMSPLVGSALTPSVVSWLNGACDYICQTFIREQVTYETLSLNGKPVEGGEKIEKKTGKKEFCLRIGPHPVYMTGFRLPPGQELPELIVNPTYKEIQKLIQGG